MTKVIGRLSNIGLGKETVPGTAVAPTYWIPVQSLDFDDKNTYTDNDSGMGRIEELNDTAITKAWAEGGYEGKIFTKSIGLELALLFGQSPTSVQRSTTGVYDHTYALLNSNQHLSGTLAYKDANFDARYPYGILDSWSLDVALEKYVTRKASYFSKKGTFSAGNTVALTTGEFEFIPKHITAGYATNLAGLSSPTAIKVTAFTIEFSKNAEALFVMGSNDPDAIVNKQFTVKGTFDAYLDDATLRNLVYGGTNNALRLDMTNTDIAGSANGFGSSGSHNPELRFDFAKVKYGAFDRKWDNNDVMMQTISFEALFSITDSQTVAARLTSNVVSY